MGLLPPKSLVCVTLGLWTTIKSTSHCYCISEVSPKSVFPCTSGLPVSVWVVPLSVPTLKVPAFNVPSTVGLPSMLAFPSTCSVAPR